MKTVILGAGISGLAAAYKTGGTVYEAMATPGGICLSYYVSGYRFENGGGHWIFGVDKQAERFIKKFVECKRYKRDAGVYFNKIYPYPIQNHFKKPIGVGPIGTMQHDLLNRFGDKLSRLFFFPFNEKYTASLYDKIAPQDPQKNPKDTQGYNAEFIYPENGLDDLINTIAREADIRYKKRAIKIDPDKKIVYFTDGGSVKYDRLICTLPLNKTCELLRHPWTPGLVYNSTQVLNIGATPGRNLPKEHWLYVPHCKSGFHRVGFYTNVDYSFAPKNRVALYVEWAALERKALSFQEAIKELKDWGWIKKVETIDTSFIDIAYTWTLPNSEEKERLLSMVEDCGIEQIGRYGRWHFQGIAESIKEGLAC